MLNQMRILELWTYMLNIIKQQLLKIVEDIDTGNSELSGEECEQILEHLKFLSNKEEKLSKYQACKYIKKSRSQFDVYVKEGKIPPGRKQQGFKEIF